ncbi:hypothetical protein HF563_00705 [Acidithiobacillus ferridurans]|nr:hypothetical protein [Acidithiobacillus ferridurans]
MKTENKLWCVYLDVTLAMQWCAAGSKEAKDLKYCPDYLVGYYSQRKDPQAQEDAAITRDALLRHIIMAAA